MAYPPVARFAASCLRRHGHAGAGTARAARSPGAPFALFALCGVLGACSSTQAETRSTANAAARPPGAAAALSVVGTAWDNFSHRGTVMWACRDLASGDIVLTSLCHGLAKDDRHWPGMAPPSSYRGMPDP